MNSVKILKYIKFAYKFKLKKGKALILQYKPALFTPNLKSDYNPLTGKNTDKFDQLRSDIDET